LLLLKGQYIFHSHFLHALILSHHLIRLYLRLGRQKDSLASSRKLSTVNTGIKVHPQLQPCRRQDVHLAPQHVRLRRLQPILFIVNPYTINESWVFTSGPSTDRVQHGSLLRASIALKGPRILAICHAANTATATAVSARLSSAPSHMRRTIQSLAAAQNAHIRASKKSRRCSQASKQSK
jgi:hypothetical protein